jgi:hypothetical protein
VLAAVVCAVNTALVVPPDVTVTLAGFKLQVGRLCALEGLAVRVQVRFIVPEYVLPAEMVAVAVVLDPGETGDGVETAMAACDVVTVVVPLALAYVASPE